MEEIVSIGVACSKVSSGRLLVRLLVDGCEDEDVDEAGDDGRDERDERDGRGGRDGMGWDGDKDGEKLIQKEGGVCSVVPKSSIIAHGYIKLHAHVCIKLLAIQWLSLIP